MTDRLEVQGVTMPCAAEDEARWCWWLLPPL